MPTRVVLLVVGSAFLHALWNALLKRTRDPERAVSGVLAASAVAAVAAWVAAGAPLPPWRGAVCFVVAGALDAAYFVTLARALTRAPLGPVYTTVRGGSLLVVWPVAIAVFGEPFTPVTAAGTLLVVAGLVATGAADGLRGALTGGRLGWAALCAIFVGGYHVTYKQSLTVGSSPTFVNASLVLACAVNVVALGRAGRRRAVDAARAEPVRIVVAGILGAGGFLILLSAMQSAGVGVVLTLRNTSILFAQLLAALQGERPKPLGIAGAILVTAGAVLLAR